MALTDIKATDYELSKKQASDLSGIVGLPRDLRILCLENFYKEHGRYGLIAMFADFIGLANSVVANSREFVEMFLICEANMSDREAEKINLPTVFGALQGAILAIEDTRGMCHGCAYRKGTPANQSPSTTCDAKWILESDGEKFMCHEELDERGEPTKQCAGFARQANAGDRAAVAQEKEQ